jgi:predicted Zn-dependent protease
MNLNKRLNAQKSAVLALVLVGCATSPTGRRQLQLMPEGQMNDMGKAAFSQMKQQMNVSRDPQANALVRCVSDAVVRAIPRDMAKDNTSWEVVVFDDASPNAFALPGGKIGVHTGMLSVAKTPSQLAAVIGHEVAHVLAEHGNERVSSSLAAEAGMALGSILAATGDPEKAQKRRLLLGLIGVGAQVGILLPYSRAHESEADVLGLDIMASAGFDPREAVTLWQNMAKAGGGGPPEFLSTHPSHGTRIKDLEGRMARAMPLYQEAQATGRTPSCARGEPVAALGE